MAQSAGAKAEALDATARSQDDLPPDRPASAEELAYLAAREDECRAAVKKIRAHMKALEKSLKTAERDLADAEKSMAAGRDLPEVQRRRAG